MIVRCVAILGLLVGGCSKNAETEIEGSESSGSSGESPASRPGEDSQPQTGRPSAPSDTSDVDEEPGGSTSSASAGTSEGDSDDDPQTSGDSTGSEPPVSPGCMGDQTLEDGEHQLMLDGYDRRYIVRLPNDYTKDRSWPLIFALHGNGGNPGYWDATDGDRNIREAFEDDAILIIPEAIDNQWRDYDQPDVWEERIELELNFFDTVYDTATQQLCVDQQNVFSMGFSGGGSFSGVLGCRRDYIRAIAVGGSVIYFEPNDCVSAPAAWITIGDEELNAGREQFREFFREHGGCDETSSAGDPGGCVDYDGCGEGTPVTFCSHPAGHRWPSIGTDATKTFFEGFYGEN